MQRRSYRDRKEDPMEEKCYQQMELLFQRMQKKGAEPDYKQYKWFAEDRVRCAGRQKQFQNVLQIIRKAYTLTLHEYQTQNQRMPGQIMMKKRENIIFQEIWNTMQTFWRRSDCGREAFVFFTACP